MRVRRSFLFFFFLLFLFSCFRPSPTPSLPHPYFRWVGEFSYEGKGGERFRFPILLVRGEGKVRMEVGSPVGSSLLILFLEGSRFLLLSPQDRLAVMGEENEVFDSLPSLPPLFRSGVLLGVSFLVLTEKNFPDTLTSYVRFPEELFVQEGSTLVFPRWGSVCRWDGERSLLVLSTQDGEYRVQWKKWSSFSEGGSDLLRPRVPGGYREVKFSSFSSSP